VPDVRLISLVRARNTRFGLTLFGVHRPWGPSPGTVLSIDTWAQDALRRLCALPGVGRAGLGLTEGGGRRLRFTASDREMDADALLSWCDVDAYDDVPLNGAVRNAAMLVGVLDDLADRYPDFVGLQRATSTVALAAVPMVAGGRTMGGYLLYFDVPQAFDDTQCADLARTGRGLGAGLRQAQRAEARRPVLAPLADPVGPDVLMAEHGVVHDPAAVGEARRFLRRTLGDWEVEEDTADTAVLCLSELVTNALIHSHAGCAVRVQLEDGVLTTTVRDSGTADAASVSSLEDPLQVHGRGLRLVDALAVGWGYDLDTMGTTVWFVLDA